MFKYILKQLKRSFVTNALFCLLLTLAGTLLCLSAGLWYSAHKALRDIDETVTTIAMPDPIAIRSFAANYAIEHEPEWAKISYGFDGELIEEWDFNAIEQYIFKTIRETIFPSGIMQFDQRRTFNAIADGITPVTLRTSGVGAEPWLAGYSPQSLAVFLVTFDMFDSSHWIQYGWDEEEGYFEYVYRYNTARFTVDEILHLHNSHPEPRLISIFLNRNYDGSAPFEPGKQYVLTGTYHRAFMDGLSGGTNLVIDVPDVDLERVVTGQINTLEELLDILDLPSYYLQSYFSHLLDSEDFEPMEVAEFVYEREWTADDGWYSFVEIEGSLEETMASERWQPMAKALDELEVSTNSFQILTSNDANSIFRFNQNRHLFVDGRTFNARESRTGARVCLVSERFAEHNGLTVGDTIHMQLYASVLGVEAITFEEREYIYETRDFWIPSMYHSGLEISEPMEFTVIGIYQSFNFDTSVYTIFPNTVVIPDRSFGSVEGVPVNRFDISTQAPLLTDAAIVPNGRIDETRAAINSIVDGYGYLFRFYDQGYDSLRVALRNLNFSMSWILALSIASWVAVLMIFLLFYVTRKQKEAALLYAIGVSRRGRFGWVFTQCTILILFALGFSLAISLPQYGDILEVAGNITEEFTDAFRNLTLSDAADSGIRSRMSLDASPLALVVTVVAATALTLTAAGFLSARSAVFKTLGEKRGDD